RLRSLEGLPALELRSVEMFGDRVAILVYDKALLNEEDIVSATFLIYGRGEGPLVKKIGARWFLSPGPLDGPGGGLVVLDDAGEEVVATFYANDGRLVRTETLTAVRSAKLSVQG
ncbi:MAG TPA: hypothetical protein VKU41_25790, partial [Polyangiaceae bacterium]|nr:hypothetical protein [Polyangiaceae bacterium]